MVTGARVARTVQHSLGKVRSATLDLAGGPARARVVLIPACVLGLSGADSATISATVPVGILTDHTRRTRLLASSIACWAVVTALSALSVSYLWHLAEP
jgi:hypothetical protein